MCELCDESDNGLMQSCQDCGRLICWDRESGDGVIRRPYVTASGDLFCDFCGGLHDRADEEAELEAEDWWEDDPGIL